MNKRSPVTPWTDGNPASLMRLEPEGPDHYVSACSRVLEHGHLYGGQVMAQAVGAAAFSAEGREIHSLHGYFLRAGDCNLPVHFEVERTRDGGTFSARRVVAHQGEGPILHMECSFRAPGQRSAEHQVPMPADVPPPEELPTLDEYAAASGDEAALHACRQIGPNLMIEMKPVVPGWLSEPQPAPRQQIWMRVIGADRVSDPLVRTQLLAYLSDYWFSGVSLALHVAHYRRRDVLLATIDHSVWFHHQADLGDWLLYEADSPISCQATTLSRGAIYRRDGLLLASTAQESLLRVPEAR